MMVISVGYLAVTVLFTCSATALMDVVESLLDVDWDIERSSPCRVKLIMGGCVFTDSLRVSYRMINFKSIVPMCAFD